MKYCAYCGSVLEESDAFCCMCGRRVDGTAAETKAQGGAETEKTEQTFIKAEYASAQRESDFPYEAEHFEADFSQAQYKKTAPRKRKNLSKPLSFILALIMLSLFLLPWLRFDAKMSGLTEADLHFYNNRGVNIIELQPFAKSCFERFVNLSGGAEFTEEGERIVFYVNGALLLIEGYFIISALHFILFGITGLFSEGKTRYYFARIGSTMLFIGLIVFAILAFAGGAALRSLSSGDDGAPAFVMTLKPTLYILVSAVSALLFRTLGIRLLRRLNAESCRANGKSEIARREFALIGMAYEDDENDAER